MDHLYIPPPSTPTPASTPREQVHNVHGHWSVKHTRCTSFAIHVPVHDVHVDRRTLRRYTVDREIFA